VLQNKKVLDMFDVTQRDTCAMLREDCCLWFLRSGQVQTTIIHIIVIYEYNLYSQINPPSLLI
jgi:hypothetical protein